MIRWTIWLLAGAAIGYGIVHSTAGVAAVAVLVILAELANAVRKDRRGRRRRTVMRVADMNWFVEYRDGRPVRLIGRGKR